MTKPSILLSLILLSAAGLSGAERRVSFNDGWRFFRGEAAGAEQPGFNDKTWMPVQLPHDWAIAGPFDRKINPHAGALPFFGTGWYRKQFTLSAAQKDRCYTIEFDGAMSNARVWLNGKELGGRPYGYIGFALDLTPHLLFDGKPNLLAVRLTPEEFSSRWYPGAGLYRNVWLDETAPVHVAHWGTYITTPAVTDAEATVAIRTSIQNEGPAASKVTMQTTIVDPDGKEVARNGREITLAPGAKETIDEKAAVVRPRRWDIDSPHMYKLVSEVKQGGRVLDRYVTPFGIRTIEFDKTKGFSLNGRHLKIHGVCMHHDLGALGSAVNRRATERQLQIMKSMGVNAVRTSHNPPSPELLEYCDRLGLMVMDEAFDMWQMPKVKNGHSKFFDEWSERDLRDMIRRDRNHPSVIMWSIGNEILEQSKADGWKVAKRLTEITHDEDRTRPVTAGFNQYPAAIKNGLAAQVDIQGFNYKAMNYEEVLKAHPDWMILGAETSSCVSSRGVYHLPIQKYEKHESLQLSSYDIIAPPWAYAPDVEFAYQDKLPQVLGEFIWTGFDYIGEPTPYAWGKTASPKDWPARSSYFGAVDLAGFPKDRYYLYQSVWTTKPMVHVLPHWNWAGREGQKIPVLCYSNAGEVELFLNGKSLGRKKYGAEPMVIPVGMNVSKDKTFASKYRLMWQVPYAPGILRAVAYKDGKQVAADEVRTAGAAARVTLIPDRTTISADGYDLSFITVRIEDKDGNMCPLADNLVRFDVRGAGRIAGVDNGNPATEESFQADRRKAFNGLALLIVRSQRGQAGKIEIGALSDDLRGAKATLSTQ